jgi:dephospho-CoA kinase
MQEHHPDPSAEEPAGRPEPQASQAPGAPRRTVVLGVLGGIASGKSHVARRLAGPEGVVIAADDLAHAALEAPEVRAEVVAAFGPGVVGAGGAIDRAALAAVVFRDTASRRRLEGWIHPWVRARIYAALEEARCEGRPRVVLDVPLLLENDAQHGLVRVCDHLVFVEVDASERERRVRATRGWEPGELARREAAQLPLDQKRRRATVVVRNEGTLAELDVAIDKALVALNL